MKIVIDDEVAELRTVTQTTGLAEENNLNAFLFSALFRRLLHQTVRRPRKSVEIILYADGLLMYGSKSF